MPTIAELQNTVNAATTSTTYEDFVTTAAQIDAATSNIEFKVADVTALPDLATTILPDGTAVFVQSLGGIVVSSSKSWVSFDGNLIRNDGSYNVLWTWGCNTFGNLGLNDTTCRITPVLIPEFTNNWCSLSSGDCAQAAIKTDGTLWTWGSNYCGRLGSNNTIDRSSPGTVAGGGVTWCKVALSLDQANAVAVKTDGTIWTWGINQRGNLGNDTTVQRSSPGTVAGGGTTWCQPASGAGTMAAVKTDGTLWTWGENTQGVLGTNSTTSRSSPGTVAGGGTTWCQVSTNSNSMAGVKTDGTLWVWGWNAYGQLGNGTTTALCSPSTTAGCGTNWTHVSIAYRFGHGLKADGTIWSWGTNASGQLGTNSTTARCSPGTTAGGGTDWCTVNSNRIHVAAVKTNGTLWTWGNGANGRLGNNGTNNCCSPATIFGGGTSWCAASAGNAMTLALFVRTGI